MSERVGVPWSGSVDDPARPEVAVHLLPALIAPGAMAGGTALVVDVLRATTVIVQALAAGCEAVIPCVTIEEATAIASAFSAGTALLAGEREGLPIPGFDLGNSPGDFTAARCRGKTLVMTTTNGTRAILAARDTGAGAVGIAALTNADAAAAWAATLGRPVHIVASGTDGHVSHEDALLAGALVVGLTARHGYRPGNDAALLATTLFEQMRGRADAGGSWADLIALGRGGRRIRAIGLDADIDFVARWSVVDLVPTLQGPPDRPTLVAPGGTLPPTSTHTNPTGPIDAPGDATLRSRG